MNIIDKILNYFFERKIKIKNDIFIKEVDDNYFNVAIFSKLPLIRKYCVWSTYINDVNTAYYSIEKAYENKSIIKDDVSLVEYISKIWVRLKESWLNIIDIICDDSCVVKKSKGVFKSPVRKWYCGFGIDKRPFKPYYNDTVHPILYINKWSLGWKQKYDFVYFEDNPQMWVCLFKFFWFGYKLISPVDEEYEDSYWEQMIWYADFCECNLYKAEKTWYGEWNKKYLI